MGIQRSGVLLAVVFALSVRGAHGHGAVTKPVPRRSTDAPWCPWCVGEHQPQSNPGGKVHHDAAPSSPCMGTVRGDEVYSPQHYAAYGSMAQSGGPYIAGEAFRANIVLNADHNGEAQWSFCPHSVAETEQCFRQRPITDWINVAAYWNEADPGEHTHSGEIFPQTVRLPFDMPAGPATLRWLWVCKNTDELFLSCIDVVVNDSGTAGTSATSSTSLSPPTIPPTIMPAAPTPSPASAGEHGIDCLWTDSGGSVTRTEQNKKPGRICWDVKAEGGATVYYQSKSDIYLVWNANACCLRASDAFGSADSGTPNMVSFTPNANAGGNFGFCECTAWDPNNPDTSCAGNAIASNMKCPVQGGTQGMCSTAVRADFMRKGGELDGERVSCSNPYPTSAPVTPEASTSSTATTSQPSAGHWDGENMKMTHYWDCSGQGCDAATLQPWDAAKYISPPGYGPQDPADFLGGAMYGEVMWLTGAASDTLSALMGDDDGCCGADSNDGGIGGCGKCALVQNPDSLHPDWTAVVMKKNRCPPWSNGCAAGEPHFDVAAPGFDNLQWSTANVCGIQPGTGFDTQAQSEAVGNWWSQCDDTANCAHLCEQLPSKFQKGCKLFALWGWKRGDPSSVKYRAVPCPAEFVIHVGSQFGVGGAAPSFGPDVTGSTTVSTSFTPVATTPAPSPAPTATPSQAPVLTIPPTATPSQAPVFTMPPTATPSQAPVPTMSPTTTASPTTLSVTPVPTTPGGEQPCSKSCSEVPGQRAPECNGKSERECKNMMNYENKCQWSSCQIPPFSSGGPSCTNVCSEVSGQRTPECNGKSEDDCKHMMQYEEKCQLTSVCSGALADISPHAGLELPSGDLLMTKRQGRRSNMQSFLAPIRALVQILQRVNKTDVAPEETVSRDPGVEL